MVRDNLETLADLDGHHVGGCTKGGKEHGYLWCLFHYSDQDALRDASNFFHNNDIRDANGNRVDPDKLTNEQLLKFWQEFNDEWRTLGGGTTASAAMAGFFTQWGWRGQANYNKAKDLLNQVNTPQGTVDRKELLGKVPTKEESCAND